MQAAVSMTDTVLRLTAPNPSPMTHTGTQTYLVGRQSVAVIDPGPDDPGHIAAILNAAPGPISHILVTHAHVDHTDAVAALAQATGAPVYAFGPATAGRSPAMAALAARGDLAGGEGVDAAFHPDVTLTNGAEVSGADWTIKALHTPGHLSNHMSFVYSAAEAVFTGDTVMGWSSTLISPPDGSVGAFMASVHELSQRPEKLYLPGHGEAIADGPAEALRQLDHRQTRENQLVQVLEAGGGTPAQITAQMYRDVPQHLHGAAMRNVLAHLIELSEQGRLSLPEGSLTEATYSLI